MTERFKNAFKFAGLAAAGVLIFYAITRLLPSNNFNQNFLGNNLLIISLPIAAFLSAILGASFPKINAWIFSFLLIIGTAHLSLFTMFQLESSNLDSGFELFLKTGIISGAAILHLYLPVSLVFFLLSIALVFLRKYKF